MSEEAWWVYRGTGVPHGGIRELPPAPPWRRFAGTSESQAAYLLPPPEPDDGSTARRLGRTRQAAAYQANEKEIELVNLALHLRRPLLITGKPGVGKSTLAYAVAHELRLGPVLRWSITSRSSLGDGLYAYDAIGRLQDAGIHNGGVRVGSLGPGRRRAAPGIGQYLRLGPLGTALLPWRHPRVLLIDEIDKSNFDLPSDLLNAFEEGEFEVPELARMGPGGQRVMTADPHGTATVTGGVVRCAAFPFVVLTSNAEREFPTPFLRRCVSLKMEPPNEERLAAMVAAHLDGTGQEGQVLTGHAQEIIAEFLRRQRDDGAELANDQLLNALLMAGRGLWDGERGRHLVRESLLRPLNQQ
ncbi:AAA family ATPase [Streptomyces sp. NPDC000851]